MDELEFIEELVDDNPKNYQIWYHLRWLASKSDSPDRVLEICTLQLEDDAKNYHTWAVRQWVTKKWSLWEQELAYSDKLIQEDFRNNSAWNERAFVVSTKPDIRSIQDEIEYDSHNIHCFIFFNLFD